MQGPVLIDLPNMDNKESLELHEFESSSHVRNPKKGEFPPPLPSLARKKNYNHLPLQVPWILLQADRSNNRVVLHELKAPQQMRFQSIRKQGRLVLQMRRHDCDEDTDSESGTTASPVTTASSDELNSIVDEVISV